MADYIAYIKFTVSVVLHCSIEMLGGLHFSFLFSSVICAVILTCSQYENKKSLEKSDPAKFWDVKIKQANFPDVSQENVL